MKIEEQILKFEKVVAPSQEQVLQCKKRARLAEERIREANERARLAEERIREANERARLAYEKSHQSQIIAIQAGESLTAVLDSRSWKITAPIRWLSVQLLTIQRKGAITCKNKCKKILRPYIRRVVVFLDRRPALCKLCALPFRKLACRDRVRTLYFRFADRADPLLDISTNTPSDTVLEHQYSPCKVEDLTPHGNHIYTMLKNAIRKQQVRGG